MIRPAACFLVLMFLPSAIAQDWPMWRFDAGHSAASPNSLPAQLTPQWTRSFGPRRQVWDDSLNHDLMPYDKHFEPVAADGRLFIGFNDADKVVALSIEDGSELWTFFTDGPVRFPPVAWQDRVFFTSDDGHLYCVTAGDGRLLWKVRGGPLNTKVLGNERVISAWPGRGGPVLADGTVYFAASIWPFMGTFIYAVNAEDGEVVWVNDSTSADYIKQPHSAPAFAGVAPQGTLAVAGSSLIVPGGRSVPAVFDRATGSLQHFQLNAGGKGNGGSFVAAHRDEYYVHTRNRGVRAFDLKTGDKSAFQINEPVLTNDIIYSAESDGERPVIRAYDVHDVDKKTQKKRLWEIEADGTGDLILCNNTLLAAGGGFVTTIALAEDQHGQPRVVSQLPVDGDVQRLLAASDRLIAVTMDGRIRAFGAETSSPSVPAEPPHTELVANRDRAAALLAELKTDSGYLLWFGASDLATVAGVLESTSLNIILVQDDEEVVRSWRRQIDEAGLYGTRTSVHFGTPTTFLAPPYVASAVFVEGAIANELPDLQLRRAYDSVRPYGGTLMVLPEQPILSDSVERLVGMDLEKAVVSRLDDRLLVRRTGALEGAADWTHQYGDAANTVKSNDSRVKLPLGVLWFGGSSNADVLPRHGHGPPEQVIGGRLYTQGINSVSCRDVYTGRLFWKREFEDLGTFDIYYDSTYADTPLNTAYNQVHIPGANGRGTNYVATEDALYLAIGNACLVLDPNDGSTMHRIEIPRVGDRAPNWGYLAVYDDILLGGNGFANYRTRHGLDFSEIEKDLSNNRKGFASKSYDISASAGLIAFDRHTGQQLWTLDARHSFLHNGIVVGDGKVMCLDKLPQQVEDQLRRRGRVSPDTYRIIAVDLMTGKPLWDNTDGVFGTWLGYSAKHGLLLQAGSAASDRLKTEVGSGMAAHRVADGSIQWREDNRSYAGPCILHNDTIFTNANSYQLSAGAFRITDGTPELVVNPLTQESEPWQVCRAYGCNTVIASENLLTFRSGAAGYYDLESKSGTGNLGGFRSGCTSNLIVANGVLNAPDYTRTCSCGYQNQTSLALIHMPEMEMWTIHDVARQTGADSRIKSIGINFGAPGDRVDERGTLWVDYPPVGGEQANLDISIDGNVDWFRSSSLTFGGESPAWIGSSGVLNATRITIPMYVRSEVPEGLVFEITSPSDDAEEAEQGTIDLGSSDLELTQENSQQVIGLRFPDIDIPRGTKIRNAVIQFTCDEASRDNTRLVIGIIDSANPATFTNEPYNVSQSKLLPHKVTWDVSPWTKAGECGEPQRTPDLAEQVQRIVDSSAWNSGNALAFVIAGEGKRVAASSKSSGAGPRLIIDADVDRRGPSSGIEPKAHTVRLHFAEPEQTAPGARVFDVALQGKPVIRKLDLAQAGGQRETQYFEFPSIMISDELVIDLPTHSGSSLLSGVEIVAE